MKGKVLTKRVLTPDLYLPKSYSQSEETRPKKYSKSFIDLMEKAMLQIKTKDKNMRKAQETNSIQTFVQSIHPSQQRRSTVKHRSLPRKHFKNTISEHQKIYVTEQSQRQQSPPKASITLNSIRLKSTYFIKARKSLKLQKIKQKIQTKPLKEQAIQQPYTKYDKLRKGSMFSDHHIEPWSTNFQHEPGNKYF